MVVALATATVVAAACSATAWASDANQDATHRALVIISGYQRFERSEEPAVRRSMLRYVARVNRDCRGVLKPLKSLPKNAVSVSASFAVFNELTLDVAISASPVGRKRDLRYFHALAHAGWGRRALQTVRRYVRVERATDGLRPSRLCSDLRAFASDPKTTPAGTATFMKRVTRALGGWDPVGHLDKLLRRNASGADSAAARRTIGADTRLSLWFGVAVGRVFGRLSRDLSA